MNLFALLLVSNAYWLHFITNFEVLYELNPLTIMTWRFNDHGFNYILLDRKYLLGLLTGGFKFCPVA
ncbi:hypothetical protein VNO80_28658 [Phaseolus coccineus]|uniref:Uncharacterized protein n=1 Tax=Phaseolus coccineus TaxID=3886 RepID=A0AAN9L9I1_PHACN